MTTLLRFHHLQERGIVQNWVTLRRWIERENFPPGMKLGANSRAWTEAEIEEWLATRPKKEVVQTKTEAQ